MSSKRLAVVFSVWCLVMSLGGVAAFAEDLGEVQKRIRDRNFKWVAERLPNPEKRKLGLLKDGFTSPVPLAATEGDTLAGFLPASLDWRNIGADNLLGVAPGNYVSRVKNQGNCGSCWAFATTAVAESTTQIAMNDPIEAQDLAGAYDLSEQVMLTCSGAGSCNGGYISTASKYISTTGLLRENPSGCYAYNYSSTTCPNPSSYPVCDQTRYRIDSWTGISAAVDAIRNALNTCGPLVTTYAVYNDFYRYYSGGIYEATSCDQAVNPLVGYHAVALVGYRDADANNPVGYFIVKNSWGTSWGETAGGAEKGYFRIAYSQVGNCVRFGGSTLAYSRNACSGAVSVFSPAEADAVQAGTPQAVTWSAAGSIGQYVKIDLYQAGKLLRTIQPNAPAAEGSYQWLVDSDLQGSGFSVVVTSTACSSASGSSGNFYINPAPRFYAAGTVNSGQSGAPGVTITFSRVSGTGTVPASVSTDAAGGWTQTGFQFGTGYRATPSKPNCSFSPAYLDFTDTNSGLNFAMLESGIDAVTSPGSGVTWNIGKTYTIKWTYTGAPGPYVAIELVNALTGSSTVINSRAKIGSGGAGSYNWRIGKQQATGSYRIRVTSTANRSTATSSGFSIGK